MPFTGEINVVGKDPMNQDEGPKMGGEPGGGGGRLPGDGWNPGGGGDSGGGGGIGGAPGEGDPSGGSLPIWEWLKKIGGGEGAGKYLGGAGMGMDAFNMMNAPQQQAMAEAKAGSMAGYNKNQQAAWQSPAYQAWASQLWGG